MRISDLPQKQDVYIFGAPANDFEDQYIDIREKEQRIYTDSEVSQLPKISSDHIHYKEWQLRSRSTTKLINYIKHKKNISSILEIGCGNGWLSAQLAKTTDLQITGADINMTELLQGARVFKGQHNLQFMYADINTGLPASEKYDMVIFAASIQYFNSLNSILNNTMQYLDDDGEIHILDSILYKPTHIDNAKERTANYYRSMRSPEMCDYYFHHNIEQLKAFKYTILYSPKSLLNKFNHNPFYWIRVRK
jgi:ubiquinone/menaquinone biosynthesis C-methylase UbiE